MWWFECQSVSPCLRDLTQWNDQDVGVEFGLIGNKAGPFFGSIGAEIKAVMGNVGEQPALAELIGGIKVMIDAYEQGEIDRLFLASNEFVNDDSAASCITIVTTGP